MEDYVHSEMQELLLALDKLGKSLVAIEIYITP